MSKKQSLATIDPQQNTGAIVAQTELDFAADAGAGMEAADQDSFAIPFLSVLQKGSPQVDEASGQAIEAARAGMFYDNVNGRLFNGKEGVTIIPCSYRREFLRWGSRSAGGGFKGAYNPEQVAAMRARGEVVELDGRLFIPEADGSVSAERSDRLNDTRNHYVLIVDQETGAWSEALLSLTSTQIKKSKMLMSALAAVKVQNSAGQLFTPPTFSNYVRVTSTAESNEKGTWFGVKVEITGRVDRAELYAAAKGFHATVSKGDVNVKYDAEGANDAGQDAGTSRGF